MGPNLALSRNRCGGQSQRDLGFSGASILLFNELDTASGQRPKVALLLSLARDFLATLKSGSRTLLEFRGKPIECKTFHRSGWLRKSERI